MGNSWGSAPPVLGETHHPTFVWKIHNFKDLVSRRDVMTAVSAPFYRSGFKWFLVVAPRYREPGSLYSYVSLGLGIVRDTMQSEPGYFVEVVFEVSIYNHSNGMYYGYRARSNFSVKHRISEFECLIPLSELLKSSDFLHDDCCVFGVEILSIDVFSPEKRAIVKATTVQNFVIQKNRFIKKTYSVTMNFLELKTNDLIRLRTFELGGHKWYLGIYPHGDQYITGCLSLYMYLDAPEGDPALEHGPAVDLVVSIVDQKYGIDHFRKIIGEPYISPVGKGDPT
ncbi:uncharacterized protein [Lolium perenne]|uniref:uncharacterized protein n=1 Tax=Lolium perenne TaxID=4522 RepID=UPI003A997C90